MRIIKKSLASILSVLMVVSTVSVCFFSFAEAYSLDTVYVETDSFDSGGVYVIVAESADGEKYALSNNGVNLVAENVTDCIKACSTPEGETVLTNYGGVEWEYCAKKDFFGTVNYLKEYGSLAGYLYFDEDVLEYQKDLQAFGKIKIKRSDDNEYNVIFEEYEEGSFFQKTTKNYYIVFDGADFSCVEAADINTVPSDAARITLYKKTTPTSVERTVEEGETAVGDRPGKETITVNCPEGTYVYKQDFYFSQECVTEKQNLLVPVNSLVEGCKYVFVANGKAMSVFDASVDTVAINTAADTYTSGDSTLNCLVGFNKTVAIWTYTDGTLYNGVCYLYANYNGISGVESSYAASKASASDSRLKLGKFNVTYSDTLGFYATVFSGQTQPLSIYQVIEDCTVTTVPGTCSASGKVTYSFIYNGIEYTRVVDTGVIPGAHSGATEYGDKAEPTCTTDGSQLVYCADCHELVQTITFPATGHDYSLYTDNGDGTHKLACASCGEVSVLSEAHTFDPETHVCACGARDAFTITYNLLGTDGATLTTTDSWLYGDAVTVNVPEAVTGYTFSGWFTDDTYSTAADTPDDNAVLYGKYNINSYTITFDTAGGTEVEAITQDYGTDITAPADPTREGYRFTGWDVDVPETMPAGNMTITATWAANSYTITFDTAGGTEVEAITQDYGTDITAPADPTREGYRFTGWDVDVPETMPAGNMTITATWEAISYTITFDTAGGTEVEAITQDYGTDITAPADPTREGYRFTGWDVDVPETMPAGNMTITATWAANSYTITFDTAGGTEVEAITQDYGTTITAPADPTREGYRFTGWDVDVPETMPAGNMTITATWEAISYTITFDTAGGTEVEAIIQDYGTDITAPADPTREGYRFTGWDVDVPETMPAGNMTITATWAANSYTITFDTAGGTEVEAITQDYGTTITAPADPTREGYRFTGWDVDVPETMPAGNMTITATWAANSYTITFDTAGGTEVEAITQDYGTDITAPADPTREGYRFTGWDADVPETMPAGNMTITATWAANSYTITFDTAGGTEVEAITQDYGTDITAPADPTREGYSFTGWDVDVPETMPAGNMTITATWAANSYTITFDTAGGTEVEAITQDYGTDITAPADPTREGYRFTGWDVDVPETMPADNMTITATWAANSYTITFDTAGGTEVEAITQDYGTDITAPADPTREGYRFTGWDVDVPETMPAGNMTITATWEANPYTITFDTAGGTEVEAITQDYGTTITAPADPTREGYRFTGWDVDVPETMPAGNMTITATWAANSYTITFDTAGGTEVEAITQDYGTTITAPADPTREGYRFTGWDVDVPETMPAGNMTITATWAANSYTITFDTAGGTEVEAITQDYGTDITAPADPTREGYRFTGWDVDVPETMPAGNMTITAKWSINSYILTVIYETEDGESVPSACTKELTYGETYCVSSPEVTGYTADTATVAGTMPAANVTETVNYTLNSYDVTYYVDGTEMYRDTYKYKADVTARAAEEKEGYEFSGWSEIPTTMPAGNVTVEGSFSVKSYILTVNYVTAYEEDAPAAYTEKVEYGAEYSVLSPEVTGYTADIATVTGTMPANDVEVTVNYALRNYDVIYYVDGTEMYKDTYKYKADVTARAAEEKEGYTFSGWSEIPTTMPAENVTVEGSFSVKSYILTVNYVTAYEEDAPAAYTEKVEYGTEYSVLSPEVIGYTADTATVTGTMPAEDVTVDVSYSLNVCPVTFVFSTYFEADAPAAVTKTYFYKDKYSFKPEAIAGYITPAEITGTVLADNQPVEVKYERDTFTATFNINGRVYITQDYLYGDTIVAPEFSQPGYDFTGWGDLGTMGTADCSFEATKTAKQYIATFVNSNGSTAVTYTIEDTAEDIIEKAPESDSYSEGDYDYVFTGWDREIVLALANVTYTAQYDRTFVPADYTGFDSAVAAAQVIIGADCYADFVKTQLLDIINGVKPDMGRSYQQTIDDATASIKSILSAIAEAEENGDTTYLRKYDFEKINSAMMQAQAIISNDDYCDEDKEPVQTALDEIDAVLGKYRQYFTFDEHGKIVDTSLTVNKLDEEQQAAVEAIDEALDALNSAVASANASFDENRKEQIQWDKIIDLLVQLLYLILSFVMEVQK